MVGLDATIIGVRRGVVMHVDLRACVPESMLCVSRVHAQFRCSSPVRRGLV